MMLPRIIPALLLKNGKLVKTINFKNPAYVGDPVNALKIYNEKEVDEIIFLDITAAKEKRGPAFETISQLVDECFMPLAYGGGITAIEEIQRIFELGVEKVSINSAALDDPDLIARAASTFGSQSIIASIDVKKNFWGKYEVYDHRQQATRKIDPVSFARMVAEKGAGELLINSVDREGTMTGYDIGLVKKITAAVSVPVIACGGAGGLADLGEVIREGGACAAAAGSYVVYQGKTRAVLINFPTREDLLPYISR